ncbi:hypothetical protein C2857_006124 [Epichloe festucae Fl1]|uniref:N-acetylglucosaminylphosphatidylinositol deacetylase n=1 Tax=Epichloe festucae (strain Fl1) TaxID=877507 RepID=A0A7S9PUC2_EPIFF|nr:hypothetical protein C2857_006124 [Epichloe festucae Fl1]
MGALLAMGVVVLLLPLIYIYTVPIVQARSPRLRNKRICLLIAHPDDEAMFFAPTLLALTRPETGNHVKVLCLSTGGFLCETGARRLGELLIWGRALYEIGNSEGLGETRKKELIKSCTMLGVRQETDVFVIDDQDFQDSITVTWDKDRIAALLCTPFAPQHLNQAHLGNGDDAPTATIDVLITFDQDGVSSHPNHISLYHGARAFISTLTARKPGCESPVELYTLTSVPILRKYAAFLDVLPTLCKWAFSTDTPRTKSPGSLLFLNQIAGEHGLPQAWSAMTKAHKSQMVWFRWCWIVLSRYMFLNDLKLERVS